MCTLIYIYIYNEHFKIVWVFTTILKDLVTLTSAPLIQLVNTPIKHAFQSLFKHKKRKKTMAFNSRLKTKIFFPISSPLRN